MSKYITKIKRKVKAMPKYNIYRINKSSLGDLLKKFEDVKLIKVSSKQVDEFTMDFYLSEDPGKKIVWWGTIYKSFLTKEKINQLTNLSYYACLLIYNNDTCYAVSLGKTHFYLRDYCDLDFGIDLAERILRNDNISTKNSRLFGSKKTKTLNSYQDATEIEFESGEAIFFLRGKTIDESQWGKNISCGHSVQFSLDFAPNNLTSLIKRIESSLRSKSINTIPRSMLIKDKKKIKELDEKLVSAIINYDVQVTSSDTNLSGVDFVFSHTDIFTIIYRGLSKKVKGDLTISALNSFLSENKLSLNNEVINELKVYVESSTGSYSKPLKFYIDFVHDRCFLLDGVWHKFNQNYLVFLNDYVNKIKTDFSDLNNFSKKEFTDYKEKLQAEGTKYTYQENYFNLMQERNGYINLDREITLLERYRVEKLDLYKDETWYFVKIGKPKTLGYVIDQSLVSLKTLVELGGTINYEGQTLTPKMFCLWLILDRKTKIQLLSEINSLIFKMKLAEWNRKVKLAGLETYIKVGYLA
ncbi:hypothetical protein GTO91_03125 [Heliobacterium undosum]|uniref:TIGR04141 family sporadically distributed protein n=1 Tax=Heliomicrobium undosum TaxID=121734 RepID=A0A845L728_9FIRM|nr:DUF6119 family protein [Heliomicrobium undosum]MZP28711.1 hypothetical protein [Heliomicrobium undosum]